MDTSLLFIIISLVLLFLLQKGIIPLQDKIIIKNDFIYFSTFSILHILAGFTIMLGLLKFFPTKISSYIILFLILVIFEIYETFTGVKQTNIDMIWDIIFGLLGGVICKYFIH